MKNTKKLLSLFLALVLVLGLAACGGETKKPEETKDTEETKKPEETKETEETKKPEETKDTKEGETPAKDGKITLDDNSLYLITDLGTIDDKSFNQGSYEGLKQYADEAGVKANYLKPAGEGDQNYKLAIDQAIEKGAKVVVTPGYLFVKPVWEAQSLYPDVKFVGVDFAPTKDDTSKPEIKENTVSVMFKEEQSGFLAGYAAVKAGYTKLGFMGGVAVPAVIRYGFGFVDGANTAAKELNKDIEVKFNYTGSFEPKPEIATMASSWYKSGTEVIFSCGGGIAASVLKAAQDNDAKMIGVDTDQGGMGEQVITSAMKNLKPAVYDAVKSAVEGGFKGGQTATYGVESKGVQISDDFSRLSPFTKEEYEALYTKLVNNEGSITDNIPKDITNPDPTSFQDKMEKVKIDFIQQ